MIKKIGLLLAGAMSIYTLEACIIVGSVDCTQNPTDPSCTDNSGGSAGAGGNDAVSSSSSSGTAGAGGMGTGGAGGSGGGKCDDTGFCGDITTTSDANLPPCDMTANDLLNAYIKCLCALPSCQMGAADQHGLCVTPIDYDAVPMGACLTDIQATCKAEYEGCAGNIK